MNISIRDAKLEDVEKIIDINMRGWQTAYRGIIDDDFLDSFDKAAKVERWKNNFVPGNIIVAEENDNIVGFCRFVNSNKFSEDYPNVDCEICALYVEPDLKRKGIGRALVSDVVNKFKKENKNNMIIWCLKENYPSRKFYERMGGIPSEFKWTEIGDKQYEEIAFRYDLNKI